MNVDISIDRTWQNNFLNRIDEDGPWTNWDLYHLAYETEKSLLVPTFDGLQAPKHLSHFTPLPHQLEVAQNVIEQMNGKAILADEVGLGKTIEAGLILKEYMVRGLVKKVLILVPASLVSQWAYELNTKFFIPAVAQKKSYSWEQADVIVSSIDTAKRSPHRDIVLNLEYDLIIIDEAHKLKNNKTKNYEFAQRLKKKFCLLLTATPVQNKIDEIFNLVSLLKPGHLGNQSNFEEYYASKNRSAESDEDLKALINKVMVRNRRHNTGIDWPKRHVRTIFVEFNEQEQALYNDIENWRGQDTFTSAFSSLTLKREACSSREAVYYSLKKHVEKRQKENENYIKDPHIDVLMDKINQIPFNSKANKALELIKEIDDKVVIFTEYRASQMYLQWFLQQHGISSVPFRGGFKRGKKDWMKELFQNHAQVLIATEAGGEGINLQFCSHMINYDLPWNPMRLEQRIGRIHRLGQKNDVHIYNLATKHTVEEHILKLLYEKINLFERVIGELDEILTRINMKNIDAHIQEIFAQSKSEGEIRIKMENLTSIIDFAKRNEAEVQGYAAT
ncbi:SNF2-related protein [Bacillus albus]|uniref:DEAD/DEAH box helicase n=1 Tax=Bacillus TaxID=1386 RepID=UPI00141A379B|nr:MULTISPECIES: SNF2-related protein [Bacillus]MBU5216847.1 DEAD/DEAH box helicase family protein [Bacillus albus]MDA2024767.1 SNF2-related protein [Bacillus cereus group sp. Bcc03]MDA2214512.1 SNF2-related protein [Bacillus cereus group sp. Bc228]MDA2226467.1 SNF2-related protein [Bacillus cereus group sp. Bc227]MDA2258839.1 SNF2-related protein [Bacillus cereus group sp. Bc200]